MSKWPGNIVAAVRGGRPAPPSPFGWTDRSGMPDDLQSAEDIALREGSPRETPQDIRRFDDEVARYRARQARINQELVALRERLRTAPAADTAALASWLGGAERGPRPEPTAPALEEKVATLEADHAGLEAAIGEVLARKAAFVAKHRKRLVRRADERVEEAHGRLLGLLDEVTAARQELADARSSAIWSALYPAAEAAHTERALARRRSATPGRGSHRR